MEILTNYKALKTVFLDQKPTDFRTHKKDSLTADRKGVGGVNSSGQPGRKVSVVQTIEGPELIIVGTARTGGPGNIWRKKWMAWMGQMGRMGRMGS